MWPDKGKGLSLEGRKIKDQQKGCLTMGNTGIMVVGSERRNSKDFLKQNIKKLRQVQERNRTPENQLKTGPLKATRNYSSSSNSSSTVPVLGPLRLTSTKIPSDRNDCNGAIRKLSQDSSNNKPIENLHLSRSLNRLNSDIYKEVPNSKFYNDRLQPDNSDKHAVDTQANFLDNTQNSGSSPKTFRTETILSKIKNKQPTCDSDYYTTCKVIEREHKLLFTQSDIESICGSRRPPSHTCSTEALHTQRSFVSNSPFTSRKTDGLKGSMIGRSQSFNKLNKDLKNSNFQRFSSSRSSVTSLKAPTQNNFMNKSVSSSNLQDIKNNELINYKRNQINNSVHNLSNNSENFISNENIHNSSYNEYDSSQDNVHLYPTTQNPPEIQNNVPCNNDDNQSLDSFIRSEKEIKDQTENQNSEISSNLLQSGQFSLPRHSSSPIEDNYNFFGQKESSRQFPQPSKLSTSKFYQENSNASNLENFNTSSDNFYQSKDIEYNNGYNVENDIQENNTEQNFMSSENLAISPVTSTPRIGTSGNSKKQISSYIEPQAIGLVPEVKSPKKLEPQNKISGLHPPSSYRRGKLPKYLRDRKAEEERKLREEEVRDHDCPPGHTPLPDNERRNTLHLLKKSLAEVMRELSSLPVAQDTLRVQKLNKDLNKKLEQIEEGIKIFSQPKVYVINDE